MKIQRETNYDATTALLTRRIADTLGEVRDLDGLGSRTDFDADGGPVVVLVAPRGRRFELRLVEVL
jgi:hypothetical protein